MTGIFVRDNRDYSGIMIYLTLTIGKVFNFIELEAIRPPVFLGQVNHIVILQTDQNLYFTGFRLQVVDLDLWLVVLKDEWDCLTRALYGIFVADTAMLIIVKNFILCFWKSAKL